MHGSAAVNDRLAVIRDRGVMPSRPSSVNMPHLVDEDADYGHRPGHSADERAYILLLYQEHAEQARQQEGFRTVWTATSGVVLLALAVASVDAGRQWICGVLICVTSVVGAIMLGKHQERYELHLQIMRGFRTALATAVRNEIPEISATGRAVHGRAFRPFRFISIRALWMLVYLVAFAGGGLLAYQTMPLGLFDAPAPLPVPREPQSPATAAPAMPPASVLTPDGKSP